MKLKLSMQGRIIKVNSENEPDDKQGKTAKERLNNLIDAILALSPSRNLITQFLATLPQDYPTVHESYPEFIKDKITREAFSKIFGISFEEKIESGTFGMDLTSFVFKCFELFDERDLRNTLNTLLKDIRLEPLLNPRKEWLELKLRRISTMPNGQKALRVLKAIAKERQIGAHMEYVSYTTARGEYREYHVFDLFRGFSDVVTKLDIERREASEIYELLRKFRLVKEGSIEFGRDRERMPILEVMDEVRMHQDLLDTFLREE